MLPKTSRRIATVLIASLPFFNEGCGLFFSFIYGLIAMTFGVSNTVYIRDSCPSNLVCQTPTCFFVGQNGSFERGPERGIPETIKPTIWQPGAGRLDAVKTSCQGFYGLHLHREADPHIEQAYQLINLDDILLPREPGETNRLRVGASFRFRSRDLNDPSLEFKLTIFMFSGYAFESFPEQGDPYTFAAQATAIETTTVSTTREGLWLPIQTTLDVPSEIDVLLVLLEYDLSGDLSQENVYVDGVDIILDKGPYSPLANGDRASTGVGEPVRIDVLANDLDPDGLIDSSTVAVVVDPLNGMAEVNEDGTITYTPNPAFTGTDTFSYAFSDLDGLTAGALVMVTVLPGNRPPIAVADSVTTAPGVVLDIDVLANDSDPDGDAIRVFAFGTPLNGATALSDDGGAIRYTPNAGFTGTDMFAYIIADDQGATSNEVEVRIIVQ